MATLQAIGVTLGVGSCVGSLALLGFALALNYPKTCHPLVCPRTASRPPQVIGRNVFGGNANGGGGGGSCGSWLGYTTAWFTWSIRQSYRSLLRGIPGTGTRHGGRTGPLLKVQLDAIVVFKFHALCYKVSVLATILCLCVVLPINVSAPCDTDVLSDTACTNVTGLTDFERTTLAHIPPLQVRRSSSSSSGGGGGGSSSGTSSIDDNTPTASAWLTHLQTFPGLSVRLVCVVLVAYALYAYTCYLMWFEWQTNLALRRVYYLEYDHYQGRQHELNQLQELDDTTDNVDGEDGIGNDNDNEEERPPYYPHPELRETVPSVGLYSVLYKLPNHVRVIGDDDEDHDNDNEEGGLGIHKIPPGEPEEGINEEDEHDNINSNDVEDPPLLLPPPTTTTTTTKRMASSKSSKSRARPPKVATLSTAQKLQQTVEFFDKVVPNQPGYSSSVVAVTVLPDVHLISVAWKKWFAARTQLERLRLIRRRLQLAKDQQNQQRRRRQEANAAVASTAPDVASSTAENGNSIELVFERTSAAADNGSGGGAGGGDDLESAYSSSSSMNHDSHGTMSIIHPALPTVDERSCMAQSGTSNTTKNNNKRPALHLKMGDRDQVAAQANVQDDTKLESFLSDDDIEQLTVYCRDYARSSGNCDPYGCDEYTIRRADEATLLDLEEEAQERVQQANEALREARSRVHGMSPEQQKQSASKQHERFQQHNDAQENVQAMDALNSNIPPVMSNGSVATDGSRITPPARPPLVHQAGRRRVNTFEENWDEVERQVDSNRIGTNNSTGKKERKKRMESGAWRCHCRKRSNDIDLDDSSNRKKTGDKLAKKIVTGQVIPVDSYAVVTFSSRQAAIAARQCVTDGSGLGRWRRIDDIPVPPLADAPPLNPVDFRGYCRPVTLTLPTEQKRWRENIAVTCVVLFCFTYTIPLTYASAALDQESLERRFPGISTFLPNAAGLVSSLLRTALLSICPQIFKFLSNFGSGASSVRGAEYTALLYYWIFMLMTAFTGTSLGTMFLEAWTSNLNIGEQTRTLLSTVAATIPTTVGATWLNWILLRFTFTLPVNYLLQFNNFLFRALHMNCCARLTAGGGPGGPMPYRVYVDSGAVFLCVIGLAPACPLIAPAAMVYFIVADPMMRFLHVFTYRPMFDGGGLRWLQIHNMLISAMIVSQVLLAAMMALKRAYGVAILAGLAIIPTYTFHGVAQDRFAECYCDAALLQTSELDGWDTRDETSMEEREQFRKWLVDCHKASYVPVCVLTTGDDIEATAEPAVVVFRIERDWHPGNTKTKSSGSPRGSFSAGASIDEGNLPFSSERVVYGSQSETIKKEQRGALFRRVVTAQRQFNGTAATTRTNHHQSTSPTSVRSSSAANSSIRSARISSLRNSSASASFLFQGEHRPHQLDVSSIDKII